MKTKVLITAMLFAGVLTANAQTEKGKMLIGGTISFSSQKAETSATQKSSSMTLGPRIGFFVGNNFAIGTTLEYSRDKTDPVTITMPVTVVADGQLQVNYGIRPFARYYVNMGSSFKFFGEANFFMDFGNGKPIDVTGKMGEKTYNSKVYGAGLNPGLAFFANKKLAIELSFPLISYFHQSFEFVDTSLPKSSASTFNFAATTISPSIGVNFHF